MPCACSGIDVSTCEPTPGPSTSLDAPRRSRQCSVSSRSAHGAEYATWSPRPSPRREYERRGPGGTERAPRRDHHPRHRMPSRASRLHVDDGLRRLIKTAKRSAMRVRSDGLSLGARRAAGGAVNVLALDLGTRTGWALSVTGRIESGVQVFDVRRGESPGMRYIRFRRWLSDVLCTPESGVDMIVYEAPHHRGGHATEVSVGFATRVLEACAAESLEHASVHSATLKKWVTGRGNADKASMIDAALVKGWVRGALRYDDNEVDALCLLHYALAELVPAERERIARQQLASILQHYVSLV